MLTCQLLTRSMLRAIESPRLDSIWCVNVHFKSVSAYNPLRHQRIAIVRNLDAFVWRARLVDRVSSMVGNCDRGEALSRPQAAMINKHFEIKRNLVRKNEHDFS
jgi:hypothetical protein